jgi:hypothetical protein
MRVLTEERILGAVDHPFLARLYGTIQTDTHLHFLMQVCIRSMVERAAESHPAQATAAQCATRTRQALHQLAALSHLQSM